ncbi:hypothetical protein GOC74_15770 [Halomicrobium mukohataei]|uniref:Aminoglycoside N(3)-acetyltransferase n=2 Tax=Halomicrobium mukohataei TaxID=57705 RepID=A0A847UD35_9EURY|nr:hypothetical protein [Halomicrobium mukohataei]
MGANADALVADHSFDYGLGDGSRLGAVYERGGRVLMLGIDSDTNTSLHLAEHRANFPKTTVTAEVPIVFVVASGRPSGPKDPVGRPVHSTERSEVEPFSPMFLLKRFERARRARLEPASKKMV